MLVFLGECIDCVQIVAEDLQERTVRDKRRAIALVAPDGDAAVFIPGHETKGAIHSASLFNLFGKHDYSFGL
jgi:hypothetical protein